MATRKTFQVMRTNTQTGAQLANVETTEKAARWHIFNCALYNLGYGRQAARKAANAAPIGEPYALENYLFTITLEAS